MLFLNQSRRLSIVNRQQLKGNEGHAALGHTPAKQRWVRLAIRNTGLSESVSVSPGRNRLGPPNRRKTKPFRPWKGIKVLRNNHINCILSGVSPRALAPAQVGRCKNAEVHGTQSTHMLRNFARWCPYRWSGFRMRI